MTAGHRTGDVALSSTERHGLLKVAGPPVKHCGGSDLDRRAARCVCVWQGRSRSRARSITCFAGRHALVAHDPDRGSITAATESRGVSTRCIVGCEYPLHRGV